MSAPAVRGGGVDALGEDAVGRVAVLERRGRYLVAVPLFERGQAITIDPSRRRIPGLDGRPAPGEIVLLAPHRERGRGVVLRPVRRIGRVDVARDAVEGLMLERGLERRFDPAVEREARMASPRDRGRSRRDLRDLPTVTIDPGTARDFDDAISAQELESGRRRIWVHIADVSAYVAPRSLVDREAARRATSVYVPGAVEPMLPESLSNGACSLVPGQDRHTVTVELDLEQERVVRAAFYPSHIRSDARLDYDQVDEIFGGRQAPAQRWAAALAVARAAAADLDAARRRRNALAVEGYEPEFTFDRDGHVVSLRHVVQTESHRLIEHLMIAANEQVAGLLADRRLPALYRVHERPDPPRIELLVEQLASLDVATPPIPEHLSPQQAADLAGQLSQAVDEHVRRRRRGRAALTALVLRALRQAYYSPRNLGHAGLKSPRYCHFTSPIRRYPDLICHRSLLAALGAGEEAPAVSGLEQAGVWSSARERHAMTVERDADDVVRGFLLQGELFASGWERVWEGEVTSLIHAGAFVRFGEHGYEGFLPVRRLRGDWWELNAPGTILHGTRSGATLRLGDPVEVVVDRVDAPRGRIDLLPADRG